jgi:hypothetical protein
MSFLRQRQSCQPWARPAQRPERRSLRHRARFRLGHHRQRSPRHHLHRRCRLNQRRQCSSRHYWYHRCRCRSRLRQCQSRRPPCHRRMIPSRAGRPCPQDLLRFRYYRRLPIPRLRRQCRQSLCPNYCMLQLRRRRPPRQRRRNSSHGFWLLSFVAPLFPPMPVSRP